MSEVKEEKEGIRGAHEIENTDNNI